MPQLGHTPFQEVQGMVHGLELRRRVVNQMADHLGDDQEALRLTDPFMRAVVANLENDWELTSSDIDEALARISGTDT